MSSLLHWQIPRSPAWVGCWHRPVQCCKRFLDVFCPASNLWDAEDSDFPLWTCLTRSHIFSKLYSLEPHSAQLQENPFFPPRTSAKPQEFLRFFIISLDCQVSHHLAQDRHAICSVRSLQWLFCELLPAILRTSLWLLPPFPLPQSPHIVTFHQPFLYLQEPGQCTHIP